jgi:small subunit ribosomal protein S25e
VDGVGVREFLSSSKKAAQAGKKPPEKKEAPPEKSVLGLSLPDGNELLSFVRGSKYVTPFLLAERFGVRLSIAKKALSELAARGVVRQVVGSNRIRIYQPVAQPTVQKQEEQAPAKVKPTRAKGKKAAVDRASTSTPE